MRIWSWDYHYGVAGPAQVRRSGHRDGCRHNLPRLFQRLSGRASGAEIRTRRRNQEPDRQINLANIKLDDARRALEAASKKAAEAYDTLEKKFDGAKNASCTRRQGSTGSLGNARRFIEKLLDGFSDKPEPPEQSLADIIKDLDSLKAIPGRAGICRHCRGCWDEEIDLEALATSLKLATSPSSVAAEIKKKIEAHHGFYQEGAKIIRDEHRTECPFCEQRITDPDPKAMIDAYIESFEDEEEKHKSELRDYFRKLRQKEALLDQTETTLARQKSRYDELKRLVPSKKETEVSIGADELKNVREAIKALKAVIEQKAAALASTHALPVRKLPASIAALNGIVEQNNRKSSELTTAVEKADEERKILQRKACAVFEREFAIASWPDIESLRACQADVATKQGEANELEKSSPSKHARERVAETFELLLREFFAKKYFFDKTGFVLKRGDREMARGPHRTLSDGEKTAIAFCYFIACIHKKVETGGDYKKLFLVFDDPVTSMSYDFVFTIAQTLKNLNLSEQGEISINPGKIDGIKFWRPELLLLTHSSYFFNISVTNRVVEGNAAFALYTDGQNTASQGSTSTLPPSKNS